MLGITHRGQGPCSFRCMQESENLCETYLMMMKALISDSYLIPWEGVEPVGADVLYVPVCLEETPEALLVLRSWWGDWYVE